jgi:hypothetical protein
MGLRVILLPFHPYIRIGMGGFLTTLVRVDHPIYMKFQLVNQSESLVVSDWDSQFIVVAFSDTLGPDNSFDVQKDEHHPQEQHLEFAKASYSWDYLQKTRAFFQQFASYWDTPPVKVWYDYDNVFGSAISDFDSLQQVYWMRLTSKGEYGGQYEYRKTAPIHEDAHLIHLKAWDIHHLHPPDCPDEHFPDTRSSSYCALVEGWAEFLSCIVTGSKALYIKHENQNLETNHWWAGPNGTNTNGSFVEGAVASAWYDMEDHDIDCPDECNGSQYYDLWGKFGAIFNIFKTHKPENITDFMDYCQSDTGFQNWEKINLIKIFDQHHIFKPGDANSDGLVTVADVVFLVNYLFKGGPPPDPRWRGDANGDCKVTVADAVYLVAYLFKQGPKPFFNSNCWPN